MRIPRDISGRELLKVLSIFGYRETRQAGSHIRITTLQNGEHHITIPDHNPIKIGTLSAILSDVAQHFNLTKDELVKKLWG